MGATTREGLVVHRKSHEGVPWRLPGTVMAALRHPKTALYPTTPPPQPPARARHIAVGTTRPRARFTGTVGHKQRQKKTRAQEKERQGMMGKKNTNPRRPVAPQVDTKQAPGRHEEVRGIEHQYSILTWNDANAPIS